MSEEKELQFFDRKFDLGLDWYRTQFDAAGNAAAVGEATPTYVLTEERLDLLKATLGPRVRLIVMVRHPAERAYSHYRFNMWRDRRSFERVVEDELSGRDVRYGYVRDGRYIEIVERVLARFPAERLHIVLLDDFQLDPAGVVQGVARFLGLTGDWSPPHDVDPVQNQAFGFRSPMLLWAMMGVDAHRRWPRLAAAVDRRNRVVLKREPMDPAVRRRLLEHYAEPNRRFAEWLGRDLSPWSR